ncbi:DUF2493 domain-containing protein [candidate division KSB1 bacterium]|nr:DUF2493 domain-containing protein [candidate division KSB1 bacterium]
MTRLVVTGGRDFFDARKVISEFTKFMIHHGPISLLIEGESEGLDKTARWCAENQFRIPVLPFPADWDNVTVPGAKIRYRSGKPYNALAGHWRNGNMILLGKPDFGMVFPGGRGTADMKQRLELAGIPIWEVE